MGYGNKMLTHTVAEAELKSKELAKLHPITAYALRPLTEAMKRELQGAEPDLTRLGYMNVEWQATYNRLVYDAEHERL